MQVTSEQISPCEVQLKIEVEPEQVAQAYDQAYRKFAQVASVPGFRKGKAPRQLLERRVSDDAVREEVRDSLITRTYFAALEQEKLEPYALPDVEIVKLEKAEPFVFTAKVPLPPKVDLGDYKGIEVEKSAVAVTDEDVEAELEYLRQRNATAEKIEDRGVKADDIVVAEMASAVEGQEMSAPKRSLVQIGGNVPGFDENLMDLKPGERRAFSLQYPDDYSDPELAGKNVSFDVSLESIRERKVPDLDDEFAAKIGDFKTLEELRADVREHIVSVRGNDAEREVDHKLIDEVISRSNISFPGILLDHEIHEELEEVEGRLRRQNVTMEQYLRETGKTQEQFMAELKESLTRRIKAGLALGRIAEAENIDVTDDDVEAEIDRMAAESKATRESVEAYIDTNGGRPSLKNTMLNRRILDYLRSVSSIKYGAETGAEST